MKMKSFYIKSILIFTISFIFMLSGCEEAKESVEDTANKVKKNTGELVQKTTDKVGESTEKTVKKVNDEVTSFVEDKFMVGEWSGKFDIRSAELKITEQNGNEFSGKILINLRKKINQDIVGSYNPESNEIIMKDQLRSKFKGVYSATLSDDKKSMTGVFVKNLDKKEYNFSLSKK